jgi:ribosomal-protein-alanine N-acetyltransferase
MYLGKYIASEDDVKALRKICREWTEADGFWEFDHVLRSLSQPTTHLYYCKENADSQDWNGALLIKWIMDQCDIIYIYVNPNKRRAGIGQKLLAHLVEELDRHQKPVELNLEVKPDNTAAIALYSRFGLTRIRTIPKYYRCGSDALVFHRSFNSDKHDH